MVTKTLMFDTETRGAQHLYNMTPREQFRLGQWAWGRDGEVSTTTDYDLFLEVVESADVLVSHNLFYDTTVMWGKDSIIPLEMALQKRLIDTFIWYPLRHPVPAKYTTREGRNATTYQDGKQKPELVKKFLALDNLTFQHDLPGKMGSLKELAKEFNPKGTLLADYDFGLIPNDDPRFVEYGRQDIVALQGLASFLMDSGPITHYEWREFLVTAINNQISKSGIRVDIPEAKARVEELQEQKDRIISWLVENFDFPTAGKKPWMSTDGKGSILKAFDSFGIHPENNPTWTRSEKTNAPSFSKDTLLAISEGTEAEELAQALATLQGQRSLAELALTSTHNDGYAHPEITSLQRSGRFSMTKPSLPIWGSRTEELAKEKRYFISSPGCKLVEMDYSNADQRIVAAMSGDDEYAKRFEPGVDGHEISGRLMFGDEEYEADPIVKRHIAKALSHAFAYGAGSKTLARTSKLPEVDNNGVTALELAEKFVDAMNKAYPWNKRWREKAARDGESGWVESPWGRRMAVDDGRSWTQSPGLLGQNGTAEILRDGLVRIASESTKVICWLKAHVHDAVIWDIPEGDLEWAIPWIKERMEQTFDPHTNVGQAIHFPMSVGKPADNWMSASHG